MDKTNLLLYKNIFPQVDNEAFIAKGAYIIGDVIIEANSGIWFNSVVRGDMSHIRIGKYSNIQDNSTIHTLQDQPTVIGDYVTVGHNAILHSCRVGDNCIIGMGSIILSYSEIGENCIIGAGTVISERRKIPPNSVVMGSPSKILRTVTEKDIEVIHHLAVMYSEKAQSYLLNL
ncbi:gamma carbonic anhydrase family protein [Pelosinus sp. IPA-1]|uniref:gamma carbonic anhydrase family protein n=1 Tax=Pelosinus sp. IPA-1 TaxID=3029569 RepID=UPI00243620FE|nr:gamma carbonic anhydrase family protein [Pelosinus sp. IPA-1]GMA98531.1 gamma carbonic anhydrase family protein [Pelosinus sp. IPA-1]